MGDSNSESSANSKAPSSEDDSNLFQRFQNLGLENGGLNSSSTRESTSQSNNGGGSSSYSSSWLQDQTYKEEVTNDTQRRWDRPMTPTFADGTEHSWRRSIPGENIWAYNALIDGGDSLLSNTPSGNESFTGSKNYMSQYFSDYNPINFSGNISSRRSCYEEPSTSNSLNNFRGNSVMGNLASMYPTVGDYGSNSNLGLYQEGPSSSTSCDRFMATQNHGNNFGTGYYLPNCMPSSNGLQNQHGMNGGDSSNEALLGSLTMLARSESGSKQLQTLLEYGNPALIHTVLMGVSDSLIQLITDQYGHYLFYRLVENCNNFQLEFIVLKLAMQTSLLLNAACNRYGTYSLQKLIKRLKKLDFAKFLTTALSSGFYELMTHTAGRHVIQHCFVHLRDSATMVLGDAVIECCVNLATHPVGCLGLNDCINYIKGSHRTCLLDLIADESVHLSLDPSGNYVVQHVLGLSNQELSNKICSHLRGRYVRLSLVKHGSHVVEKCLSSSDLGMIYFVEEIKNQDRMLEKLALDQFGNYVIQTALRISKLKEHLQCLHKVIVKSLQPHLARLEQTRAGVNVVRLIRDQASFKKHVDIQSS